MTDKAAGRRAVKASWTLLGQFLGPWASDTARRYAVAVSQLNSTARS